MSLNVSAPKEADILLLVHLYFLKYTKESMNDSNGANKVSKVNYKKQDLLWYLYMALK